jgi:putative FmdB family regulatory protein
MPIYTYQCDNCGVRFEHKQGFNDPVSTLPRMQQENLRKVFTPVGIVFKGSGFYATDHRSPSGQGRASKPSSENEKKSDGEKKSESSNKSESSTSASSSE